MELLTAMIRRPSKRSASSALDRATELLAVRDRSVDELRRRLGREGYAEDETAAALERLRSRGALDDAAMAGRYARRRLRHGGVGTRRIRVGLTARGIPGADIRRGLDEALAEVPETEALEAVVARRWPAQAGADEADRLRRLAAFLLRRGFPPAAVGERLRRLAPGSADAISELDDMEPDEPADKEER